MFWYGHNMSGWGYGLMTVSIVLFWALVIVVAVALFRYLGGSGQRPKPPESGASGSSAAEELLAERFARGEIDEEEYRRRLEILRTNRRPT